MGVRGLLGQESSRSNFAVYLKDGKGSGDYAGLGATQRPGLQSLHSTAPW